jgi:hypothetical protein
MKLYLYTLNPHAARPMKLADPKRVLERACRYAALLVVSRVSKARSYSVRNCRELATRSGRGF